MKVPPLVVRLYFAGLLQVIALIAVVLVFLALRPEPTRERPWREHAIVDELERALEDSIPIVQVIELAHVDYPGTFGVRDPDGKFLASNLPPHEEHRHPPRQRQRDDRGFGVHKLVDFIDKPPPPSRKRRIIEYVHFPSGRLGTVEFRPRSSRPDHRDDTGPFVLVMFFLVGVWTVWLARSFGKPLSSLQRAAETFGQGQFETRVTLNRNDEFGEVARALNRMAERIQVHLRTERELIANVSHELRTPLARIRVALSLMEDDDPEELRESLAGIEDDLGELETLIADVLTFARLDFAKNAPNDSIPRLYEAPFEIGDLLREAHCGFQRRFPKRPTDFMCAVEGTCVGDASLVRRAVENLLDNAHKYTPDQDAPIVLHAAYADDSAHVVITIRDEGFGISEKDQARIFEPFFRVNRPQMQSIQGSGLGLALVRRIAHAHGGTLEVQSAVGEGTTMRLSIAQCRESADSHQIHTVTTQTQKT